MSNPVLDAARAKRDAQQTKLDAVLHLAAAEERELTEAEATACEERIAKRDKLTEQVRLLESEEARKEAAAEALAKTADEERKLPAGDMVISPEPMNYSKQNHQ